VVDLRQDQEGSHDQEGSKEATRALPDGSGFARLLGDGWESDGDGIYRFVGGSAAPPFRTVEPEQPPKVTTEDVSTQPESGDTTNRSRGRGFFWRKG
jgi:hypothetical protein